MPYTWVPHPSPKKATHAPNLRKSKQPNCLNDHETCDQSRTRHSYVNCRGSSSTCDRTVCATPASQQVSHLNRSHHQAESKQYGIVRRLDAKGFLSHLVAL
eukprot:m.208471 g.208471  ORF g.208471 m.208471 type:complete len:101 (-) comp15042_c0_seq10:632-934(-)